jgi:hypothetical protein
LIVIVWINGRGPFSGDSQSPPHRRLCMQVLAFQPPPLPGLVHFHREKKRIPLTF